MSTVSKLLSISKLLKKAQEPYKAVPPFRVFYIGAPEKIEALESEPSDDFQGQTLADDCKRDLDTLRTQSTFKQYGEAVQAIDYMCTGYRLTPQDFVIKDTNNKIVS